MTSNKLSPKSLHDPRAPLADFSEFVVVKPFRLEKHIWDELQRAAKHGFRKGPEQLRLVLSQWYRERVKARDAATR